MSEQSFTIDDIVAARNYGMLMSQIESAQSTIGSVQMQIDSLGYTDQQKQFLVDLLDQLRGAGLN